MEFVPIARGITDRPSTVTATAALLVGFDARVAVTVIDVAVLTMGAVYKPPVEIVPALALQITEVSALLVIVAVNCNFAPDETTALSGETFRIVFDTFAGCAPEMEEQLAVASTSTRRQNKPAFSVRGTTLRGEMARTVNWVRPGVGIFYHPCNESRCGSEMS